MASLAGDIASMTRGGNVSYPSNPGTQATADSGAKSASVQKAPSPQAAPQMAQGRAPRPPRRTPQSAQVPPPQQKPQFSAQNPPMMTQPPPVPHPGLRPPYPDARSPAPQMMPNGQMVMPPSSGFIGANMPPRVPATFIPGMSGLLGRLR